jgi:ATP-dependent DNA helicase
MRYLLLQIAHHLALTIRQDFEIRYKRLDFLLEKSAAYASILQAQMDKKKLELYQSPHPEASQPKQAHRWRKRSENHGKRRRADDSESSDEDSADASPKRMKSQPGVVSSGGSKMTGPRLEQPALVTGGKLKDYQLEGVEWMVSLDQNGISGILGKSAPLVAEKLRFIFSFRPSVLVPQPMRWA